MNLENVSLGLKGKANREVDDKSLKTVLYRRVFLLCLRLLEKRRHYVIASSDRVKECKSVNATEIPNEMRSKADANPRLTGI